MLLTLALLSCSCQPDTAGSDTGASTDSRVTPTGTSDDTATETGGDSGDTTDTSDTGEPCDTGFPVQTVWGEDADGDGELSIEHGGEDCDDTHPFVYPGAPEACDRLDHDCDGDPLAPGVCAGEIPGDQVVGWSWVGGFEEPNYADSLDSIAILPDTNGDGLGELAIDCYYCSAVLHDYGPPDLAWIGGGVLILQDRGSPLGSWVGEDVVQIFPDYGGPGVDNLLHAGDVNGDGVSDLVWAEDYWYVGVSAGPFAWDDDRRCPIESLLHDAEALWLGATYQLGWRALLADLDLDDDGFDDLIIGGQELYPEYTNTMYFYVVPGREHLGENQRLTEEVMVFTGDLELNVWYDHALVSLGDLDGNGQVDVLVSDLGRSGDEGTYAVIVPGPDLVAGDRRELAEWTLGDEFEDLGGPIGPVAPLGDRNGNGVPEFVYALNKYREARDVVDHDATRLSIVEAPPEGGELLRPEHELSYWEQPLEDLSGWGGILRSLPDLVAADVDGDEHDDLVILYQTCDDDCVYYPTTRWWLTILPGRDPLPEPGTEFFGQGLTIALEQFTEAAVWDIAVGDLDQDGYDDIAIAGHGPDEPEAGNPGQGQVVVFPGWDIPWDEPEYW